VGKKSKGKKANLFVFVPPIFYLANPGFSVLGFKWAKAHRCPPRSQNLKRELFNYNNTVLFLPKIQGGHWAVLTQSISKAGKSRVRNARLI